MDSQTGQPPGPGGLEEEPPSLHSIILRNMAEGVCLVRAADAVIVYTNPRFEQMFGYGPGGLVGMPISATIAAQPDRTPEQVAEGLIAQLRERSVASEEVQNVRKDGTRFWARLRCSAFEHPTFGPVWVAVLEDITDSRQATEQLRAQERRLKTVIDVLPVGVWFLDRDGTVLTGNPAGQRIWGGVRHVGIEEFDVYQGWFRDSGRRIAPHEWAGARAVERGETTTGELIRIRSFDGREKTLLTSATPLRSEDGTLQGAVVVNEDITHLEETQALFEGIVTSSTEAILTLDVSRRITFLNVCAGRMFGLEKAQLLGLPVEVLFAEGVRPQLRERIEALLRTGEGGRVPGPDSMLWARRHGAADFPVEVFLSRFGEQGRTLVTMVVRDVTERRRLQDAQRLLVEAGGLLASALDFQQTLRSVASLAVSELADFCAVDILEGERVQRLTVASASPANAGLAEALQRLPPDLTVSGPRTQVLKSGRALLIPEVTAELLDRMAQEPQLRRMFALLPVRSLMIVPLVARERTLGILSFLSTREGSVYGERELKLAEQLALRSALALDNVRLLEQARQATRAREELLSVVAHDLRSPLQTVQLQALALLRGGEKGLEEGDASLRSIVRAAGRMDRLIEDLLDVARIQGHTLRVRPESLSPEQLLSELLEGVGPQAGSHELRLRVAPGLPRVWGDPERLVQVLGNLVGNALKFTPAGGRIVVGAEPMGEGVTFFVSDTGPGLSSQDLSHLFEPFWQRDATDRRGLGLGLTICQGIVEAHGSRLQVDSEPGRGSTFSFTLAPARPSDAADRLHVGEEGAARGHGAA